MSREPPPAIAQRTASLPKVQTMRAAVLVAPGRMELESVPVPEPGRGEIRVRLEGCGICGSNLPPWEGRPWFKYPFAPGELGHEGWGVVDAVGSDTANIREGQRVSLLSYHSYAEYDIAPAENVVCLPGGLQDQPFPGEPLGCAMNVFKRAAISSGQKVAIIGVGFLGAVLVSLAASAGAEVIAITRRPFALGVARQLGAAWTIPMLDHQEIVQQVKDLTKGAGCHCVIEAVGQQWPLDLAGELTSERGRLIIAGYHQDGPRQVNMQLWNWRGLDVINAHERDPRVYIDGIRAAVVAVENGKLDPKPLFTHRFPLNQIGEAFSAMQHRPDGFLKGLITLQE